MPSGSSALETTPTRGTERDGALGPCYRGIWEIGFFQGFIRQGEGRLLSTRRGDFRPRLTPLYRPNR